MLTDRYDNSISTEAAAARDAYIDGVDRFLGANAGADGAFEAAIAADPGFALAHMGLARTRQVQGRGAEAYPAIRKHVDAHPRDAMAAQTCTSVFGLIGFSGQPGREAEQLAYTAALLPHYGDDWWFLSMHAFAQAEVGQTARAVETIERSLAGNPRSAHGAHVKSHIHYEAGETEAGFGYIRDWVRDYDRDGMIHCHVSWHVALWALEQGDVDLMWATVDDAVRPGSAWGPPLNVLSDTASILFRAGLAGVDVAPERWQAVSDYASEFFPKPGIAFADVHAAIAHAMAGRPEALERLRVEAAGPAADLVAGLAEAFGAIAGQRWAEAVGLLTKAMADHARIGGSKAQRDLIEYALLNALLQQGQGDQAALLLAMRRPLKVDARAVAGI